VGQWVNSWYGASLTEMCSLKYASTVSRWRYLAERLRLRTTVVSGWRAWMSVSFPLGSTSTPEGRSVSEVVADDVAGLVARMFVMSHVLAATEVRYKHKHCHIVMQPCTDNIHACVHRKSINQSINQSINRTINNSDFVNMILFRCINSWHTFSPYLYYRVYSELTCHISLSDSSLSCSCNSPRLETFQAWNKQAL